MSKESDKYFEYASKIFDDTIYPDLEKVPKRLAIIKRNEWVVNNSDFLIAYVKYSGGAEKNAKIRSKEKTYYGNQSCLRL